MHHRHDQAPVGLGREAEVDAPGQDDVVGLDPGVEFGIAPQGQHGEPGQQGEQAHRRSVPGIERGPRGEQFGGIDVHPDGRLGDLAAGPAQLVGHRPADTGERDPGDRVAGRCRVGGGLTGLAVAVGSLLDVGPADQPGRARAADRGEVEPASRAILRTSGEITRDAVPAG